MWQPLDTVLQKWAVTCYKKQKHKYERKKKYIQCSGVWIPISLVCSLFSSGRWFCSWSSLWATNLHCQLSDKSELNTAHIAGHVLSEAELAKGWVNVRARGCGGSWWVKSDARLIAQRPIPRAHKNPNKQETNKLSGPLRFLLLDDWLLFSDDASEMWDADNFHTPPLTTNTTVSSLF